MILLVLGAVASCTAGAEAPSHDGWEPFAVREEIRPEFAVNPGGGLDGAGGPLIRLGQKKGEDGAWRKSFPVTGGKFYRLTAFRKTTGVALLWRNTYVELVFTDDHGGLVRDEMAGVQSKPFYLPEPALTAGPWTKLSDTFRAPLAATRAMVDLRLRWVPGGVAEYGDVRWEETDAIANQIFLVTSSYTTQKNWMRTGVWDTEGRLVAAAEDWGEVVVHELDLNHRHIRPDNLGDYRGRMRLQRPLNSVDQ